MLNPLQFRSYYSTGEWNYIDVDLYNPSISGGYYEAALTLPHGATITKVVLYSLDQDTKDIKLDMFVCRVAASDSCNVMASIVSDGTAIAYRYFSETVINYPIVDNQIYSYFVEVSIPGGAGQNLRLSAVRIDYDYPAYLPVVTR